MSDQRRIGVFGGTFDPIHNTHLAIARAARDQAQLDTVLFVVSANPPHKQNATFASAEDRYALVEAAVRNEPGFLPSRIELDRNGPSYMADTLAHLHAGHAGAAIFLIIGMDSLVDLPRWRAPERILSVAHLLVVPRPGECEVPAELDGHYTRLQFEETELSSTEVRSRIAAGEPCEDLLPAGALHLIQTRGLYRERDEDSARG